MTTRDSLKYVLLSNLEPKAEAMPPADGMGYDSPPLPFLWPGLASLRRESVLGALSVYRADVDSIRS